VVVVLVVVIGGWRVLVATVGLADSGVQKTARESKT
jgi:hypothetical protein